MLRDIAIIGGGPVGLCAAMALDKPGRVIQVIEAGSPVVDVPLEGLNARSIALSLSTVQVFKAIGLWDQLASFATPMKTVHVSTKGRFGVTRLKAGDLAVEALGYVIESHHLNQCLESAIRNSQSISLSYETEVSHIQQTEGLVNLTTDASGVIQSFEARLCLVADGALSPIRQSLGIEATRVDYGQSVVICNVEVDSSRQYEAFERFTDAGPLAMLPLGDGRFACVWTMSPEQAEARMALSESSFIEDLQNCFGMRLGYLQQVGKRSAFPISRISAQKLSKDNCLMLGNAANALHPVAGQSYNLAIRDIAYLQALLADVDLDKMDEHQLAELINSFEDQRQREQREVIRYSDALISIFSNGLFPISHLRGGALAVLDLIKPLKNQLAYLGMGFGFDSNPMLRGRK